MGYIPPQPPPPPTGIYVLPKGVTYEDVEALRQRLWATPMMIVSHGIRVTPPLYYAPRPWTERHLGLFSWGLLGSVFSLVGVLLWIVR